ncbi:MAG: hypothetical protein RLY31_3171 [Bacteroidota bacterium]|jgi:uncharacterized protein YbcC (UPF0753/DUF2309 family)
MIMGNPYQPPFDEEHVLHELHHYLPSQTPIKDFIHHNTLHAFQDRKFYDAIFLASKIFGYQVTLELSDYRGLYRKGRIREAMLDRLLAERKGAAAAEWKDRLLNQAYDEHNLPRLGRLRKTWSQTYSLNMDDRVHPALFRILAFYLDQGIANWRFPNTDLGFLPALRRLERDNLSSFFQRPRARRLLQDESVTLSDLLQLLVGNPALYEEYLFEQQFAHHGWSGMVATVERLPESLLSPRKISLRDLIHFELLLEIDRLDAAAGDSWQSVADLSHPEPAELFAPLSYTDLSEVLRLWQDAFEWSYYDEVLAGLHHNHGRGSAAPKGKPFQAIFCIDERECSLRRHLETLEPDCETLGCPGFFGVEFFFKPQGARFYEKLCPAPVTPTHLIKESAPVSAHAEDLLYHRHTNRVLRGWLTSLFVGFLAGYRLVRDLLRPKMSPAISNAFGHMGKDSVLHILHDPAHPTEGGLKLGYTPEEMAERVERTLRSIGMTEGFAPLVYAVAHGSSSANNPHHGAHDCGACSGRPGATNARVFCAMANMQAVRNILADRGIRIPDATQFIGAMHDTASDLMEFYDVEILSLDNRQRHWTHVNVIEQALDLNAKERSRRFASIDTKADIRRVRKAIQDRSVSMFEPRPELGHGTNALCIVGRRSLTRGLFLDRRAFLNSYDYRRDPDGELLLGVMKPLPPVCGGINLEYYFSRVDNQKFGAGTKLPHNVMGLVGVANSSDGDLRPGLPLQMIEVHDPVRLLIIVEHHPEVVLDTIRRQADLYEWFANEWVHLVAFDPVLGSFHRFVEGMFVPYQTMAGDIPEIQDLHRFLETAAEMETNHILHATGENLKVHALRRTH